MPVNANNKLTEMRLFLNYKNTKILEWLEIFKNLSCRMIRKLN